MSEAPRLQDLRSHLDESPYHLCILPSPLSLANESQDVVRNVANNFIAALEANSSLAEIQFLVGLDGTKNIEETINTYSSE
ncbi:uncharacterized protein RCO7_15226 [Rhynchosporium graminicola]|uniref:Uncharacterized protein n=1 Tax=Rhynchosporium graminicola TaxID=2792576 RepID=A0A1E1LRQ5_9HELO|nr:uncharacterized protein RCO7_15226 [Rhynchosporium commune]